jgi:hypothetical protein
LRKEDRDADQIKQVEQHQNEAGDDGAGEQVGDGYRLRREIALGQLRGLIGIAELIAEQHQHGCRRKNLRQGRGRRHRARRERLVVAVPQHGRQHDQSHGHGGGADDALCGGQQHADNDHRETEAARQRAEQAGPWFPTNPRRCANAPASRP